ncbi:MAG: hypothetical protein COB53_02455 [Elusimicrobia bacterium]|nr:MAG: hypothetical protein COB53_02455 [Elusimicrobiota bacterium]
MGPLQIAKNLLWENKRNWVGPGAYLITLVFTALIFKNLQASFGRNGVTRKLLALRLRCSSLVSLRGCPLFAPYLAPKFAISLRMEVPG